MIDHKDNIMNDFIMNIMNDFISISLQFYMF